MTDVLFLLGVAPRSGTNYLADVLTKHPDIGAAFPFVEAQVLANTEALDEYSRRLFRIVDEHPNWGGDPELIKDLNRRLGAAVRSFLADLTEPDHIADVPAGLADRSGSYKPNPRYVVMKSPTVANLHLFNQFFAGSPLVLLVRDGRATTESLMRTFGTTREVAMHQWLRGANRILEGRDHVAHQLVRYEDVVADPKVALAPIFEHLGLGEDEYPWDALESMPVRGSSVHRGAEDEWHWKPVESEGFAPLDRFADWTERDLQRFAHVAGEASRALGYDVDGGQSVTLGNRIMDFRWNVRERLRSRSGLVALKRRVSRR